MKKIVSMVLASFLCLSVVGCGGNSTDNSACEHKMEMVTVTEATCQHAGKQEIHCAKCGMVSKEIDLAQKTHFYEVDKNASFAATCTEAGETVKKCYYCGDTKKEALNALGHSFGENVVTGGLKEWNDSGDKATFYKACAGCGERSNDTFTLDIAKAEYMPTSPTVTMYETEDTLSYGFTWNSKAEPLDMELQIAEKGSEEWEIYDATVEERATYESDRSTKTSVYICKTVVELEPSVEYTYKLVENVLDIESDTFSFTSVNPSAKSFTFASFGDSQNGSSSANSGSYAPDDGALWTKVLENVSDVDFYTHTGDICQNSCAESNWDTMLDKNKAYFATTPMMVALGNHDSELGYAGDAGISPIYNHFNNNIPVESKALALTNANYFHSFTYGNAKFIMLNTNDDISGKKMTATQLAWLEKELKNNEATWTIVMMHNPLYSIGNWGSNNNQEALKLREDVGDLFAKYGVDLVIQGHDHEVFRTYPIGENQTILTNTEKRELDGISYDVNPQGPIYIMNGPTGNQNRGPDSHMEKKWYEHYESGLKYSWAEYTVEQTKIVVSVKYLNGNDVKEYYSFGIMKL